MNKRFITQLLVLALLGFGVTAATAAPPMHWDASGHLVGGGPQAGAKGSPEPKASPEPKGGGKDTGGKDTGGKSGGGKEGKSGK